MSVFQSQVVKIIVQITFELQSCLKVFPFDSRVFRLVMGEQVPLDRLTFIPSSKMRCLLVPSNFDTHKHCENERTRVYVRPLGNPRPLSFTPVFLVVEIEETLLYTHVLKSGRGSKICRRKIVRRELNECIILKVFVTRSWQKFTIGFCTFQKKVSFKSSRWDLPNEDQETPTTSLDVKAVHGIQEHV